jgi:hypothetical protein
VAKSIRSATSPWRSARSLVRGAHLASSIARARSRSTDDRDHSSVISDLPPVFSIENGRLRDRPRQRHATIKSRHLIRHLFFVFERVCGDGEVTSSRRSSRRQSGVDHGRKCRLLLGGHMARAGEAWSCTPPHADVTQVAIQRRPCRLPLPVPTLLTACTREIGNVTYRPRGGATRAEERGSRLWANCQ